MFIDGDFPTSKECKYHCRPTCHPGQIGDTWKYGCLHDAWGANKYGDFCPLVDCDGNPKKCEIPEKIINRTIAGCQRRLYNIEAKRLKIEKELSELILLRMNIIGKDTQND